MLAVTARVVVATVFRHVGLAAIAATSTSLIQPPFNVQCFHLLFVFLQKNDVFGARNHLIYFGCLGVIHLRLQLL